MQRAAPGEALGPGRARGHGGAVSKPPRSEELRAQCEAWTRWFQAPELCRALRHGHFVTRARRQHPQTPPEEGKWDSFLE